MDRNIIAINHHYADQETVNYLPADVGTRRFFAVYLPNIGGL